MLNVGDDAPDFTLTGTAGEAFRLRDLRGDKRALLVFYPKDQTSGCTAQLCAIRDAYKELREHDIVPLGVNPDDAASHEAFIQAQGYQFDLLVDADREVAKAYGALKDDGVGIQRTVVLIGKDGKILLHEAGAPGPERILALVRDADDSVA